MQLRASSVYPYQSKRIVTCKEIHEQITAFVGNRVDEAEYRSKVEQQIKNCPDCRATYEQELKAKLVVRDRSQRTPPPDAVRTVLADGKRPENGEHKDPANHQPRIAAEQKSASDRIFTSPIGIVLAVLLVLLCGWIVLRSPGRGEGKIIVDERGPATQQSAANVPAKHVPENLFNKAANNFTSVRNGQLAVQHVTDDKDELGSYFKENGVAYNVLFLPIAAELEGGVISQHDKTRLAHMIYTKGDVNVYVIEVPRDLLAKGDVVYVTDDVLKQLDGGKVFWEEPAGHTLAMFKRNDLVFAIVSNARQGELSQLTGVK